MIYTPLQLEALQRALATGERRVTFADKTVEYRSVAELQDAIRVVTRGLAEQAVSIGLTPPPARQVRVTTDKGL